MARELRLTVKRPSSLLSVVIDREISDVQLQAIQVILENERMAFNVVEDDRIRTLIGEQYGQDILDAIDAEVHVG